MKNKVLRISAVIILIIAMTMSDFILIGTNIVHALENINNETNHDNVKFTAYFKTEEKEVSKAKYEMNSREMKLYMKISVKKEGYFEGVITLNNSNFKFKQNILSEEISKIEGNVITLNRLRAGNTVEIEVAIEPIISENYEVRMLSKESTLKLTGNYKDSTEKNIKIEANKNVELSLLVPNDIETTLEGKVITNRIYKIGEANKRLVQIELNSEVVENAYPIKNTTFEMQLPKEVEKIEVISKGTYATNGEADKKLEESYYEKENNILKVTVENTNNSWKKDAVDIIIVTLILPEKADIEEKEYNIKSTVQFQGEEEKSIEKEIKYKLNKEADGIIRTSIENKEQIYKGKIYSKEERQYNSTTNIEINYANLIEGNSLEEKTIYRTDSEEKQANVEYKTTTIKKSEIEKILGTEGKLTIKSGSDLIAEVTKNTQANEDGNIVITYKAGVKEIQIEVTKAVETGIIRLNHTKTIKTEPYSKEEITALRSLVEQVKVKYKTAEYSFERIKQLQETKTFAEIQVDKQTLSTAVVNEQVKMAITLKTDSEKYDLYKNPTLTIKLPEGIKNVSNLKTVSLYLDDFTLNTMYDSAAREIKITLVGEQTKYNVDNTNGYIEVLADIEIEETMPSRQDKITLTYTNEKAVAYENEGTSNANVNISGHRGLVAFNQITNYNLKTNSVTNKGEKIGTLKMYEGASESNFQIALVNNTGTDLKNVKVLGNLPVEGNVTIGKYTFENTIAAKLKSEILTENGNATIYYTANKNATNEVGNIENGWNTNLSQVSNPVLYMIVISNMAKGTKFTANYTMNIPENLEYNKDMKTAYVVNYATAISNESVAATPVGLETGKVLVTLEATRGTENLENDMTVNSGEVIKYKVSVTNTGSSIASNVKISSIVPEGTVYVEPVEDFEHKAEVYYKEIEKETVDNLVETLLSKETKIFEYEVRVKNNIEKQTIQNQATVTYGDNIEVKSNRITNKLEQGTIRVTVKRVAYTDSLMPGAIGQYYVVVENTSNTEQKDINVKFNMPEEMTLKHIEELEKQTLEVKSEWSIDSIAAGKYRIYSLYIELNKTEASNIQAKLNATSTQKGKIYQSNVYTENLYGFDAEIKMTSPTEGEYVKTDDIIEYNIEIKNDSQIEVGMTFIDNIPHQLSIQKIEIDGVEVKEAISDNSIHKILDIKANSTMTIKIVTVVNYDKTRLENETITNVAKILYGSEELGATESINHIIESIVIKEEEENPEEPGINPEEPGTNPDEPSINPDTPSIEPDKPTVNPDKPQETVKNKYNISGRAWVDQDKDGEMNNQDNILKDIKVKLLNIETNGIVRDSKNVKDLVAQTNEEGYYEFKNITEGKYIVVFEYDQSLYKPTIYQKSGVDESRNSNVVSKNLAVNGEEKHYATTNEIELKQNLANINMGLVFIKKFDIKLDKYVSKVIVQTSKNTTTYNYQNKDFAKVDINAKRMIGSTILVQYTIKATNIGDVDAYVNSLVDYVPTGLKYSSELNKDWYEEGTNLYTNSLAKVVIAPGESKEVNLILTKTKDNGNAELINNMAEIQEAYNIYGIADTNSTPANKNKDENDIGSADLMISIQTGTVFNYMAVVVSMLGIIAVSVYLINKKVMRVRF